METLDEVNKKNQISSDVIEIIDSIATNSKSKKDYLEDINKFFQGFGDLNGSKEYLQIIANQKVIQKINFKKDSNFSNNNQIFDSVIRLFRSVDEIKEVGIKKRALEIVANLFENTIDFDLTLTNKNKILTKVLYSKSLI